MLKKIIYILILLIGITFTSFAQNKASGDPIAKLIKPLDRKKDLIIRGGFNIFPRDVEDILLQHPAVAMAGVVGRPDERLGEEVVAFVSLRPGTQATPAEIIEFARGRLAAHKYPREVTIVDMVPLTSVGKLDRKALRGRASGGHT